MADQTCRAISRDMLRPGDHICTERCKGFFYHHGIYVGDDMVIHVNGPRKVDKFSGMNMKSSFSKSSSSVKKVCSAECQRLKDGSIKTCLDCFLNGNTLYVYDYNCNVVRRHIEEHGGRIKLPEKVVELAYKELRGNEFCAGYDLFGRNCEHFATFCKTGLAFSMQSILFDSKAADAFNTIRLWMFCISAACKKKKN